MNAKETILSRISQIGAIEAAVPVAPIEPFARTRHEIVEQFAEYAAEYRANVIRTTPAGVVSAISEALSARGSQRVIVAGDLPIALRPEGVDITADAGFENLRVDEFQAVITTCAVAIAETGTIVLDGGAGQGRRAITLIPDHHICLVYENQVVHSVPEGVKAVSDAVSQGRPLTWISGPSATSDIELSRVEGVHGPRILDVLLIEIGPLNDLNP